MSKTIEEVRKQMDDAYARDKAYKSELAFEQMRGAWIRRTTLFLADASAQDPEVRVLDVGCGQGGIASFWPHHNVVGIDISPQGIELARKTYPSCRFEACPVEQLCLQSLNELPFELIVAQESIEHWVDVRKGLERVRRAIKDGGKLVMTTPNRDSMHCRISRKLGIGEPPYCAVDHIHEFGYEELIETVEKHGFRHEIDRGVYLAPYWTCEKVLGHAIRKITDEDPDVNAWMHEIGGAMPTQYAFIQCHRFVAL